MVVRVLLLSAFCLILHAAEEKLVNAQFQERTDGAGGRWDVQPDGQVGDGTNDCFDNALMLQVNGQPFQPQKPQQTADGAELVLGGQCGAIAVTRRIRLDAKRNVLRYAEVLVNNGSRKEQVTVMLQNQLGGNCQQTVWSDGKPQSGAALPKGCVGLAAIQRPNRPTVVWLIGEPKTASPPQVAVQGNRMYQFTWTVSLAPKQSQVLFHYVLQRPGMSAAQVPDLIKTLWKSKLLKPELPRALLAKVANFRITGAAPGTEEEQELTRLPAIAQLLERAAVDDAGAMDLVGVGRSEAERMRGRLTGGPLTVTTPQGPVTVTVDELAGGEGGDPVAILHLRSGESLAATRITGALALETEAGVSLPVDPVRVLWMATRARREDQKPPAGQQGVLELVDGTRLALTDLAVGLPLTCVWGRVEPRLARLVRIVRVVEPTPAWLVTCDDGSTFRAVPAAGELTVATHRFGAVTVPVGTVASFQRAGPGPSADAEAETEDGAQLGNGDRLAGGLAGPVLVLRAGGKDSAVPVERIAAIERPEEGAGLALVLKEGGRLVGEPIDGVVSFLAGGCTFRVPAERIQGWKVKAAPEAAAEEEKAEKEGKKEDAAAAPSPQPPPEAGAVAVPAAVTGAVP